MRSRPGKLLAALAAAAVATALAPAAASAVPASIVGTAANTFSAASYDHDAGTVAQMTSTGGSHNATSSTAGLFSSNTISSGTTPVNGTQYLPLGTYAFSCTVHPGMNSSLNVNAGIPKQLPTVALKVKTKSLDQALKKGVKVEVTITGGSGEQAEVTLKLGNKVIGGPATTTATGTVKMKLNKKGKSAFAKKDKAKVTAAAAIDFGAPASAKSTLK